MFDFLLIRRLRNNVYPFGIAAITGLTLMAPFLAACSREDFLLSNARADIDNPASSYCIEKGGDLQMVRDGKGVHGLCHLPDGRVVEEWDLFRQDHPSPNRSRLTPSPAQPSMNNPSIVK